MEKQKRIAPDQLVFAVPAALFLLTPLLDLFINYFETITSSREWETFKIIPYLPLVILGVLLLSLIVFLIKGRDKNIFRAANRRTRSFQTTLLLFVLYFGLVLMSIGVNGFTYYAVHGHPYTKMSMWIYMANVLLYLFFSSLVYDERVKSFLARLCCVVATLYAIYGMLQYIYAPYAGSLSVTYHNSNHYGYYLAVSISLTTAILVELLGRRDGEKGVTQWASVIVWCAMMFVQCFALGYNNTLGAWLAVLFTHVFLFIVYRVKDGRFNFRIFVPFAIFLASSVISAFFTKNIFTSVLKTFSDVGNIVQGVKAADEAGSGRWKIWRLTVKHIIDRPVFGNGIEGLLEIITLEGASTGSPHNEFLEYMAFFGVPAGLCYFAACLSVFLHALKYRKELDPATLICLTGGFGYLVSSFFGVCFYYTVTFPFIFLGLALNFAQKDRPLPVQQPPAPDADAPETEQETETDAPETEIVPPPAGE